MSNASLFGRRRAEPPLRAGRPWLCGAGRGGASVRRGGAVCMRRPVRALRADVSDAARALTTRGVYWRGPDGSGLCGVVPGGAATPAGHGRLPDQRGHVLRARRRAHGAAAVQLRRWPHLQVRAWRERAGAPRGAGAGGRGGGRPGSPAPLEPLAGTGSGTPAAPSRAHVHRRGGVGVSGWGRRSRGTWSCRGAGAGDSSWRGGPVAEPAWRPRLGVGRRDAVSGAPGRSLTTHNPLLPSAVTFSFSLGTSTSLQTRW